MLLVRGIIEQVFVRENAVLRHSLNEDVSAEFNSSAVANI
jgi:hypothetical protein